MNDEMWAPGGDRSPVPAHPHPQGQPNPPGQPDPQGQPYPQGQQYPQPQGQLQGQAYPYGQVQGQPYPQGYPYPGPGPYRPSVRPAPGLPQPVAVEQVPGTPFGVAIVGVAPATSGPASASLVVGVASILVALVVGCFGLLGVQGGWGPMVSGAFAVLAGLLGLAALVLGRAGLRQIRRVAGWATVNGRGLAIAGMICGAVGLFMTVASFLGSVALVASR